jgi:membrane protein implicated in regulation of membrane protease activity
MWRNAGFWDWVVAAMAFCGAGFAALMAMMFLGLETGVVAMCSGTAPAWWATTWVVLFFTVPLVSAYLVGHLVMRGVVVPEQERQSTN